MKISTRTRYGTRLMIDLAVNYGRGSIFLKDIAKREDVSEKYLSQIIIALRTAKLVNSFRGAHGGYVLARSPEDITLKDIFEALEGNFSIMKCSDMPHQCQRSPTCVARDLWTELAQTLSTKLESIKLSELVKKYHAKSVANIMYTI